jgi:hypothetical protein
MNAYSLDIPCVCALDLDQFHGDPLRTASGRVGTLPSSPYRSVSSDLQYTPPAVRYF